MHDGHDSSVAVSRLSAKEVEAFGRPLDYSGNKLWDLVNRRSEPPDPDLVGVVELLRGCWRGEQERRT